VSLGLALVFGALAGSVYAGGSPPSLTPEIDPGSMANALLLLSGGLLIVTGRRPRKQGRHI